MEKLTDETIEELYGKSAYTTFYRLYRVHKVGYWQSFNIMLAQVEALGTEYQGGLSCTCYRRPFMPGGLYPDN